MLGRQNVVPASQFSYCLSVTGCPEGTDGMKSSASQEGMLVTGADFIYASEAIRSGADPGAAQW